MFLVCLAVGLAACSAGTDQRTYDARALSERLDISQLTPLEAKRLEKVVNTEVSPCGDAVTLAESLFNPEHCPLAPLAGRFVIKKITEDYNSEEISRLYAARYAALKGLDIPVEGSPVAGAEKPVVTLVVFTDFECPFCARAAEYLDELLRRYPNRIALVHKNLPLATIHTAAELAARAGYAAQQQGKFWQMHATLFSASGSVIDRERIKVMAIGIGLDIERFEEDLASAAATAAIESDKQLAKQLGVSGTPAFFINGRMIEGGERELEERIAEEFLRNKLEH